MPGRAKLEAVRGRVKPHLSRRFTAGRLTALALGLTLGTACAPQPRPAPPGAANFWPAYLGNPARAPFVDQRVGTDTPHVVWSAGVGNGVRGMPVVTDEVVVAATTDQHLFVVSRQDGSEYWRERLDGPSVSPLVSGDRIYTLSEREGKLRVLRLEDGDKLAELDLPSVSVPATLMDEVLYLATEHGSLQALDPETERRIWETGFPDPPVAGPLVIDPWIVYAGRDSLRLVSRGSGRALRSTPLAERIAGELASDGERVYATTEAGSIRAWELTTLNDAWESQGFDPFRAGPVLDDGSGYAVSRTGQIIRFRLQDGAARILADIDPSVLASPVLVANGLLVGALDGTLHFLSRNGAPLWTVQLEGSIDNPVYVHAGRIIVPLFGPVDGPLGAEPLRGKLAELR